MTLTQQENECAMEAVYDLASGYPQVELPNDLCAAVAQPIHSQVATANNFGSVNSKGSSISSRLVNALHQFLGRSTGVKELKTHVTYSGSSAITRSLVACQKVAVAKGLRAIEVVLLSPCIDIYELFAAELAGVDILRIDCIGECFEPDVANILKVARSPSPLGKLRVFLIATPENPTGYVWSHEDLQALAAACAVHCHCLILDHSFLMAGVQSVTPTAMWDLKLDNLLGCALWDTGKTFGLNGEKLGFILSTPRISLNIADALAVMHFSISSKQQSIFAEVLKEARRNTYLAALSETCRKNRATLLSAMSTINCNILDSQGGTFALVNVGEIFSSDAAARESLLLGGVGVVTASTFFHHQITPKTWIRIALARNEGKFAEAIESLSSVLRHCQNNLDSPHSPLMCTHEVAKWN